MMQPRLAPLHPLRVTVVVGASSRASYSVVALLLRIHGLTLACSAELASLPPAGCAGVPVIGVGISHMPGAHRIGGVWETAPLWLTGGVLRVTAPPGRVLRVPAHRPIRR